MSDVREAKRRAVREALSDAARRQVLERGLEDVTVEDIAVAVGVSTRTFFNYFPSKDDAIIGFERAHVAKQVDDLRARPASESPIEALHAVLFDAADAASIPEMWEQHNELVHRHPALFPRYLASMVEIEMEFAAAIAERIDVDPKLDPRPRALVASVFGVLRATVSWWLDSDRSEQLLAVLERNFRALVTDLNEP